MPQADFRALFERSHDKGDLPLIMGIVNITPDSFSGDGVLSPAQIQERASCLIEAGAEILDIGAESTRPGSSPVSENEERERLHLALSALSSLEVPLSIDTRRPVVFRDALPFGASLINDIDGLSDPGFITILQDFPRVMAVLMHKQGSPETMQDHPHYENVVESVAEFFREKLEFLQSQGISRDRIILDPGIGFGKTREHNLSLLAEMKRLSRLGPLLIAPSRKRFLDAPGETRLPADRDLSTGGVMAWCCLQGALLFRTHRPDVAREIRRTLLSIEGARLE
ncbi:MAG: dihydropteroate synthase [Leptospirillia bacterium]